MAPKREYDDDPEEEEEEAEEAPAEEEEEAAAEEEEEAAEEEEDEEEEEEEEEDLVDPREDMKERCSRSADCKPLRTELNKCNQRLEDGDLLFEGENCTEELFNFLHCVDHCIAPQIIKALK